MRTEGILVNHVSGVAKMVDWLPAPSARQTDQLQPSPGCQWPLFEAGFSNSGMMNAAI
jgi:hypothetical protein